MGTNTRISRKSAIAEAALPLFAEHGFNGTTTKLIASASGVSEALIYKHYPSKLSIYKEIQDLCCANIQHSASLLAELPPNLETLFGAIYLISQSIINSTGEDLERMVQLKKILLQSLATDGQFAREFTHQKMAVWIEPIQKSITQAHKEGHLNFKPSKSDLDIWFSHHSAVMLGVFLMHKKSIVPYKYDRDELVDHHVLFCLRGIGVKEESLKKYFKPKKLKKLIENIHLEEK